MSSMRNQLQALEQHLLRGAGDCAAVLGVSYSNYAAMKSGGRPVPRYISYHVDVLLIMPLDGLHRVVKSRLKKVPKK